MLRTPEFVTQMARPLQLLTVLAYLSLALAVPVPVHADDMDLALSRLRLDTSGGGLPAGCSTVGGNGLPRDFCPDNQAFGKLMSDLAGVAMPVSATPARSSGFSGFQISLLGTVTALDSGADHWQRGTEGSAGSVDRNTSPAGSLFTIGADLRKGLPFGFELNGTVSHISSTQLFVLGAGLSWSLFEGYRTGYGLLPDVAVEGGFRTVVGDADFSMAMPHVGLRLSKPLVMEGAFVVSPMMSGQLVWVFASSELVDFTPDVDAYDECIPDPGSPTMSCTNTAALPDGRQPGQDYNNTATFDDVSAMRARLNLGAELRYQNIVFAAVFGFDLVSPSDLSDDLATGLDQQWTVALSGGLRF